MICYIWVELKLNTAQKRKSRDMLRSKGNDVELQYEAGNRQVLKCYREIRNRCARTEITLTRNATKNGNCVLYCKTMKHSYVAHEKFVKAAPECNE